MKQSKLKVLILGAVAVLAMASCDKKNDNKKDDVVEAANIEYSSKNANSWHNYMNNVAALLKADATALYTSWATAYNDGEAFATTFKSHNSSYKTALNCVEQILEGCQDIASEVGTAKIGDPYDLYQSGKTTEALYAVESWYSWHSRDDYTNNIYSIRNSYYGSLDGNPAENSLYNLISTKNADLHNEVVSAISGAAQAIQAIPQPFRNNINSTESGKAMDACAALEATLVKLESYIQEEASINSDEVLDPIVTNYVDVVVLPTYKALQEKATALQSAVTALNNDRTSANFSKACNAWLEAREPWESSEAFLFGPVDELGLDPNMDSWPLDQDAIVKILESGNYNEMNWSDGDSDEAIEAAQSVRGFHTLEFLLFKDGLPRTVE
ncbi:MAG: peptidase M75 [Bacteroidales bacterium]|nr:peptidase M75 [Bacteroidales bacterium]